MIFGSKFGGYIEAEVKGKNSAEFLNVLASTDISLWNIVSKEDVVTFCIALDGISELRRAAHHCGCDIEIRRRGGLSFGFHYLKQRRNAVYAAVFAFLLLWCALSFVWKVEIVTEEGTVLSEEQITAISEAAEACGIHPLLWKASVDPKETAAAIQQRCDHLSWVGISVQGVTIKIHVAEKMEDTRETALRGNVVAKKSGTIRSIFVLKGQKAVEVGDEVNAGDVLISGDIVYEEEGKEPVYDQTAAKGTILASVWYEGVARMALEQSVPLPTGKTAGILWLRGPDTAVVLWGEDKDPFSHSVVKEGGLSLWGWTVSSKTYREAEIYKKKISEKEARALAEKEAGNLAKEQMTKDSVLLDRKVEVKTLAEGIVEVRVLLECEEKIGEFRALP